MELRDFLQIFERKISLSRRLSQCKEDPFLMLEIQSNLSKTDAELVDLLKSNIFLAQAVQNLINSQVSRQYLLSNLRSQRREFEERGNKKDLTFIKSDLSSISKADELHCSLPTSHLYRRTLRELQIYNRDQNGFLLCRIISQATQLVAITFIIEDLHEDPMQMSVYNYPIESTIKSIDAVFKVGRIFILKTPMIKLSTVGLTMLIRCDNPSNLCFIDHMSDEVLIGTPWFVKEELLTDPLKLKERGNLYVNSQNWLKAINCYTEALNFHVDEGLHRDLLSNRAQTYLMIGEYQKALIDATAALEIDSTHVKSIVRQAKAFFGLEQYNESAKCWAAADVDKKEKEKALAFANQSENGIYDWDKIFQQVKKDINSEISCATFFSKDLIIQAIAGKGKGVICRKDISKGSLLLVEPALGVSKDTNNHGFHVNFANKRMDMDYQNSLLEKLMIRAANDAWLFSKLLNLSTANHAEVTNNQALGVLISAILATCSWGANSLFIEGNETKNNVSALFYRGSQFNHSCVPNCWPVFIGNLLIIVALRDFSAGEELTVSYVPYDDSIQERKEKLLRRGFECNCVRCTIELSKSVEISQLDKLCEEMKKISLSGNQVHFLGQMEIALKLAQSIPDNTYAVICMRIDSAFRSKDLGLMIQYLAEAVEIINFPYMKYSCCLKLIQLCGQLSNKQGKKKKVAQWNTTALNLLKCLMPSDLAKLIHQASGNWFGRLV